MTTAQAILVIALAFAAIAAGYTAHKIDSFLMGLFALALGISALRLAS